MIAYLIAGVVIIVYGAWYASDPLRWLKKKYSGEGVPKDALKAARVIGILIAVIGAAVILYGLVGLIRGR